jgi:hypothetical protein
MKRLAALAVFAALAAATPARADVLYSNLRPDESYDDLAIEESGPESRATERQAVVFTVPVNATFDGARLALGLVRGANEIDLRLYSDAGGQPGAVLESIHASGQMPRFGDFNRGHLVSFDSAAHPFLQAGTYWLLPFAPGDTIAEWNHSYPTRPAYLAYSGQAEPTTWIIDPDLEGAIELSGTPSPAPEPGGLALALVALAALGLYGSSGIQRIRWVSD